MHELTLSEKLRERDMRLVDLARAVGVDKATVTRWSKKRVPQDRIAEVSKATGIPPAEIRPDLADIFAPTPSVREDAA